MGWTGTCKPQGMSMDEFFEKEIGANFVGKGAFVHLSEYYRAFEWDPEKNGKKRFGVLVCMVQMSRDRNFNIYYKDMTATMGPGLYNCPERILKMVEQTEPFNEWEKDWRRGCWNAINKKKLAKGLKAGDIIKFKEVIEFTNGSVCDTFCVREGQGRKKLQMYKNGRLGMPVRISNWRKRDFEIIGNVNEKVAA